MVHHALIALAGVLGSVPAAIVVATLLLRAGLLPLSVRAFRGERVRAALAPQLAALRERHGREPGVLAEKTAEVMRGAGAGPFAGLLPVLAQAPFIWLLYREFTGAAMRGHTLLGADLTARLVGQPGLVAGWGIVAALAVIAVWNVAQLPGGSPWYARALAFSTVVFAAFVPLAAGLYLVTTGAWTAAERRVFRRLLATPGAGSGNTPGAGSGNALGDGGQARGDGVSAGGRQPGAGRPGKNGRASADASRRPVGGRPAGSRRGRAKARWAKGRRK